MSCLGFISPSQRARLRASTNDGDRLSSFRSPAPSPGKVERIRHMARADEPKIRESAALAHLTPVDVLSTLAKDCEVGVRCCVARNENTPAEVLAVLAGDSSESVRGWVAANAATASDLLDLLATDEAEVVRTVAAWARRWDGSGAPST